MNLHTGLASGLPALMQGPPYRWYYVRPRFQAFLDNLAITEDQASDGQVMHQGIVSSLNRADWNTRDGTRNRILIGSWGKFTRVRPPRDVDILFVLPVEVYWRFQQRTGNRQSQLLQEVKNRLQTTYLQTDIRGDGQVVVVPIKSFQIEALIMESLSHLSYGGNDEYWFDWLVRDSFGYMISRANGWFSIPVTGEVIQLGDEWRRMVSCEPESSSERAPSTYEPRGVDQGLGARVNCFGVAQPDAPLWGPNR